MRVGVHPQLCCGHREDLRRKFLGRANTRQQLAMKEETLTMKHVQQQRTELPKE